MDNLHSLVDSNVKVELLWLTHQWGLKPLPLSPSPSHLPPLFLLLPLPSPSPSSSPSPSPSPSSFPPFSPSPPPPPQQATYAFLAKFEELQTHTLPLNDLAQQMYPLTPHSHPPYTPVTARLATHPTHQSPTLHTSHYTASHPPYTPVTARLATHLTHQSLHS